MQKAATISTCSRYRYSLRRMWGDGLHIVCFIMLNPSTADADVDDPTIRRCIGFGKSWHFDALEVVNLFAWRETKPYKLRSVEDPVGPDNDEAIMTASKRAALIICAWGAHDMAEYRQLQVLALLKKRPLYCLGTTKTMRPKHPLYVPYAQQPLLYRGALL